MLAIDLYQLLFSLSYFGIFLWFAFFEQLTPIPEEVSLISVGYISMHTELNPLLCGTVSLLGLLSADNVFFYLSLKGSKFVHKLTGKVNSKLLDKVRQNLQQKPRRTLIILALLPKLRFLSPVISAAAGIPWKLFLLINSLATAFYVAVYMLSGILFHNRLQSILRELHALQHTIFIIVMMALTVLIFFGIKKHWEPLK